MIENSLEKMIVSKEFWAWVSMINYEIWKSTGIAHQRVIFPSSWKNKCFRTSVGAYGRSYPISVSYVWILSGINQVFSLKTSYCSGDWKVPCAMLTSHLNSYDIQQIIFIECPPYIRDGIDQWTKKAKALALEKLTFKRQKKSLT